MDRREAGMSRWFRRMLGWIALATGLFVALMAGGGLIGANPDWREPDHGVEIMVATNGFHTELILPAQAVGIDWHALFPPGDLADRRYHAQGATSHVAIGWGERDFYLNTPDWASLDLATAARAAFGSPNTLIHVYHMRQPRAGEYARRLVLTESAYRRLAAAIARDAMPAEGRLRPIRGYGRDDLFYEARGRYSLFNSCNEWTARHLRDIGVRVGIWTPMAAGVMRWFPPPPA